jgi:hypothetical protein
MGLRSVNIGMVRAFCAPIVVALCVFVAGALPASSQQRHAFVVGIDTYQDVPSLQRARNDARAVADALTEARFRTQLLLDPDENALLRELATFSAALARGDEVAFFFAGHGVEIGGRNYLLPSDIPDVAPGQELVIIRRALPLDDVIREFNMRGVRLSVLFVDACRDNPFQTRGSRTLGRTRGLGDEIPPEGTFIVFSAGAGQAALDGLSRDDPHPNSIFTRVLVPRLTEPGLGLRQMVQQVRSEVRRLGQSVGFDQFPAVYDQLDGTFTFVPAAAETAAPRGASSCTEALPIWQSISGSDDAAVLESYVETFQSTCPVLATLARGRLAELDAEEDVVVEPAAAPSGAGVASGASETVATSPQPEARVEPEADAAPQAAVDCGTAQYRLARLMNASNSAVFRTYLEDYPTCGPYSAYARDRLNRLGSGFTPQATPATESALEFDEGDRRALQRMLAELGFQPGGIDGVFGPATRGALAVFTEDVFGQPSEYFNAVIRQELLRVHELMPEIPGGSYALTFYHRGDPAWLQANNPSDLGADGSSFRSATVRFEIDDGRIVNARLYERFGFAPVGQINSLELDEDGTLIFDVTFVFFPNQEESLTRFTGELTLHPKMLPGVDRPVLMRRFDVAYFADVALTRTLPRSP